MSEIQFLQTIRLSGLADHSFAHSCRLSLGSCSVNTGARCCACMPSVYSRWNPRADTIYLSRRFLIGHVGWRVGFNSRALFARLVLVQAYRSSRPGWLWNQHLAAGGRDNLGLQVRAGAHGHGARQPRGLLPTARHPSVAGEPCEPAQVVRFLSPRAVAFIFKQQSSNSNKPWQQ